MVRSLSQKFALPLFPKFERIKRASPVLFLLSAILVLAGCGPKNTQPAAHPVAQNQQDLLSKYSVEQLSNILTARGNKSVYNGEPQELAAIPSSTIAANIEAREKTIYGPDRRHDYFEIQDTTQLQLANSVASVVRQIYLEPVGSEFRISKGCPTLGEFNHLCSKESYASQVVPAVCTAFVVSKDVVATAGHCVDWLASSRIVFGFRLEKNGGQVQLHSPILGTDVYRPVQVIAKQYDPAGVDFALVRVDRPMVGHPALAIHVDGDIPKGTFVYTLGYPSGLPLKLADGAIVNDVVPRGYFVSNLDTFGGNSGSPVFNANDGRVEGILVRGGTDYTTVGNCKVATTCPVMPDGTKTCSGEAATLMSRLSDALRDVLEVPTAAKAVPNAEPAAEQTTEPIVRTFRSGDVLSGSGANFSPDYEVVSDPAPPGYKIGPFVYSLTGDRGCNAWSRCLVATRDGRVAFRFSLQGHNEWPPPGQAKSEGILTVTYVPLQ